MSNVHIFLLSSLNFGNSVVPTQLVIHNWPAKRFALQVLLFILHIFTYSILRVHFLIHKMVNILRFYFDLYYGH